MNKPLIILIFTLCSCTNTKIPLKNITIVYSEIKDSSFLNQTFNSSYIVLSGDTIIKVKYPYTFSADSLIGQGIRLIGRDTIFLESFTPVPPQSLLPYKFTRKGKVIFMEYFQNGRFYTEPYYSLDVGSTLKIYNRENICSKSFVANAGTSQFTGRDTVLKIYNHSYKCWIFSEFYTVEKYGFSNHKTEVYLEKNHLIPMMEIDRVYNDDEFKQPTSTFTLKKISCFVPGNASAFRRYYCD